MTDERGFNRRGASRLKTCLFLFLFLPALASPSSGHGPRVFPQTQSLEDSAIPAQFAPLYQNLDESLRRAREAYPFTKGLGRPSVAPNLVMASSMYGAAEPGSKRWQDLLLTLDAYKAMGADTVYVQILAPDLAFGDPSALLGFYRRLASEVHARNMRFYVEHFVNSPFEPNAPPGQRASTSPRGPMELHDDAQTRKAFLEILEREDTLICKEIKPDFLTLLDEPQSSLVQGLHLSFSAEELASWVGDLTRRLKSAGASPDTLLGAGIATWEPEEFALRFARQASLDYIDFHFFLLQMKGEDQAARLEAMIRKVRFARPGIQITVGEAWLFKIGPGGPAPRSPQEMLLRSNFDFWSPLDQQFLAVVMGVAQEEGVVVVVPYFSQYFFTYNKFGDAETAGLPTSIGRNISATWDRALDAIRGQRLTPTGRALCEMLGVNPK